MRLLKVPRVLKGNEEYEREVPNLIIAELKKSRRDFEIEEIHLDNKKEGEAEKLIIENSFEEFRDKGGGIFIGGNGFEHLVTDSFNRAFRNVRVVDVRSGFNNEEGAVDVLMENCRGKDVLILINMGSLDPAFAPGVWESKAEGMSRKEFFNLLKRLLFIKSIRGVVVSGICREKDENYDLITIKTAARIIGEFLNGRK